MSEVIEAEVVEDKEVGNGLAQRTLATTDELSIEQVVAQVEKIQQVMKRVMKDGEHFGVIPGTGKPTLLKSGAEKLCHTFKFAPTYPDKREMYDEDGHYTASVTCRLTHIPTGLHVAEGEGLCSTKESKYAYRKATRACPACGNAESLKKSKKPGEGWYCWNKIGGCGRVFAENEPAIVSQNLGRVDNPDLADSYNTVLKMACKRALIAATLNGTAASDIFTQDIGDNESGNGSEPVSHTAQANEQASSVPSDVGSSQSPRVSTDEPSAAGMDATPPQEAVGEEGFEPLPDWLSKLAWEHPPEVVCAAANRWRTEKKPDSEPFSNLADLGKRVKSATAIKQITERLAS